MSSASRSALNCIEMPGKFAIFMSCVLPLLLTQCVCSDNKNIYNNLVHCYRGNRTEQWTASSTQTLIEIIRKVENAYPTSLDIRVLSANIIHRLRIDGIERASGVSENDFVTPYKPTGIMTPKFNILLKLISDVPANLNFDEVLTPPELCHLHRLVSSTVEPYIRGDESRTCLPDQVRSTDTPTDWIPRKKVSVINNRNVFVVSDKISRCPVESGVVRTYDYGTLSPGIVIASIAAGLQPQMVQINDLLPSIEVNKDKYDHLETMDRRDTEQEVRKLLKSLNVIDNIYAAGIAGDLAEVCVYQVPYYNTNVSVGTQGYWNDVEYPTRRYIYEDKLLNWAMTDSEILGGLDGFHLANNIRSWTKRIQRLRLSQILEMYYSPRGIPTFAIENANQEFKTKNYVSHHSSRSIDRGKLEKYQSYSIPEVTSLSNAGFEEYFDTERYIDTACERKYILNQISKERLKEQTYFLAQILQYAAPSLLVEDHSVKAACNAAVDRFFEYSTNLISQLPECIKISGNYKRPMIDLIIIIDGSRTKIENLKLISYLSEIVDVSSFGSRLSVIHGTNGQHLVKQTHSIVNAFESLHNYQGPYPTVLSLSSSLNAVVYMLEEQAKLNQTQSIVQLAPTVLVVSQDQQIRQDDFDEAKSLLKGPLQQFRDMQFVFLTNVPKTFEELTADVKKSPFNDNEKYKIIESNELDPKKFSKVLSRALISIPKRLIIPRCDKSSAQEGKGPQEFEDYLSPSHPLFYKIDAEQLVHLREFRVLFLSVGYGDLTVCKYRNASELQCHSTTGNGDVWFNITQPCDTEQPELCSSLTFRIEMDSSRMKCVENDCRYPDQVRFLIRPQNADCKNNAVVSLLSHNVLMLIFVCVCSVVSSDSFM